MLRRVNFLPVRQRAINDILLCLQPLYPSALSQAKDVGVCLSRGGSSLGVFWASFS